MENEIFNLLPTALEEIRGKGDKVTKRTLKEEFRILLSHGMIRGINASHRYVALRKAKEFALNHNLDFHEDAQKALSRAAKIILQDMLTN